MENFCTIILRIIAGVTLLTLQGKVCCGSAREQEARLIRDLLKGNDPDARPVKNASDAITVRFTMTYNQLQELDEPTQVVKSLVWINMYWNDVYMKWNESEYGGYKRIRLDPSRIWKPDLTLYNNANKDGATMYDKDYQVIVSSNGDAVWSCPLILESVCPINIEQFPFDTQKCILKIGSWNYDGLDLDLKLMESTNGINLANLEANSVWELKSAHAQRNSVYYVCCTAPYIDLTYTLEFRRKPLYYIMTIIFPSILLSFLSCISFLFPAGSGERVSLVISVLLGLIVFMLIVNDRTPVTSDTTPMITHFFNAIGATTVLALMATAFILHLNHADSSESVPRYLANIRDCIACVLRMKRESPMQRVNINFDDILLTESPVQRLNVREFVGLVSVRKQLTEEKILKELQKVTAHLEEEFSANEIKQEWHYTMIVFNRFFLFVFFFVFVGFTVFVLSFL